MSDVFKQLSKMKADYDKLVQEKGKEAFKDRLKDLFEKHSNLEWLSWSQYIPSFNDGDACSFTLGELRFGASDINIDNKDEDIYDEEDGTDLWSYGSIDNNKNTSLYKDLSDLENDLSAHDDVLEAVFGANVKIYVTPKGIEISDYDCGY